MSLPATTIFANPPAGTCPDNFTQTVAILNQLVSTEVDTTLLPYLVQDTTPTADQHDYIWFKTVSGKPTGIYKYYNGIWRKVYTGVIGDIKIFHGDPSPHFDGTGKGIPGGEQDGWYICNGQNSTPNLADRFIVGSDHYSGDWKSDVRGADDSVGGVTQVTLDANTTYRPVIDDLLVHEWTADGNAGNDGGPLFGEAAGAPTTQVLKSGDAGKPTPDPFWIIPPYYAMAILLFRGYF